MNPKIGDTFFLDEENKSEECKIITVIYKEETKKHYLIYEYTNNLSGDIFVSTFDPTDEEGTLQDVTEEELKSIAEDLSEYTSYEWK